MANALTFVGGGLQPCPTTDDVYFGTDPGAVDLICADVKFPTCDPGPLTCGTTYYWQVCSKNADNEVCGPVWSFTTLSCFPPDFDCDGDIDLADFLVLHAGFSGPGTPTPDLRTDLDGDEDTDLRDALLFQNAFTGSQ